MADPDYTVWPLASDVTARLARVGLSLRVTGGDATAALQAITDEVTGDVSRETLRQFVASEADPSTRLFDGTGTAQIEVDEFITFVGATAIGLNADPGYPLANVIPYYEQGKPQTRLIRGQGGLPAFQVAAVYQPVPTIFPYGRQNIQVQAYWGYGPAIPTDLWQAVCGEIARRAGNEALFNPDGGMVASWREGDQGETYVRGGLDGLGWADVYRAKLKDYKIRAGRRLRNLRAPMI